MLSRAIIFYIIPGVSHLTHILELTTYWMLLGSTPLSKKGKIDHVSFWLLLFVSITYTCNEFNLTIKRACLYLPGVIFLPSCLRRIKFYAQTDMFIFRMLIPSFTNLKKFQREWDRWHMSLTLVTVPMLVPSFWHLKSAYSIALKPSPNF